ncbi:hypothetical protein FQA39_LY12314 [Lamprigera yunnana]|nr:hypothetical protein FQA39_LY12314 [Lamprigera yunnana]
MPLYGNMYECETVTHRMDYEKEQQCLQSFWEEIFTEEIEEERQRGLDQQCTLLLPENDFDSCEEEAAFEHSLHNTDTEQSNTDMEEI